MRPAVLKSCLAGAPLIAVCLASAQSGAPDAPSFALAALRRDGILVPFATFDGRRWSNRWPRPTESPAAPIALEGVPQRWLNGQEPAGPWTVWPLDGEPFTIRALAPIVYEAQCLGSIGLQTDYQARERIPPPHVHPHPKDGLALIGDGRLERIDIVPEHAESRTTLGTSEKFAGWFAEAERLAVGRYQRGQGWRHPIRQQERESKPVTVEALYSSPLGDGRTMYYFEATRRYKWPGELDQGCDVVTLVQGWLVADSSSGVTPLRVDANLFDCELRGASLMLPLGLVRLERKTLWIVQWSGWGHESYSVIDLTDKRLRPAIATFGGGCDTR